MKACVLLAITLFAYASAACTIGAGTAYQITNNDQYTAVSDCTQLTLTLIQGTTVDLSFPSLTQLNSALNVQGVTSNVLSLPVLTTASAFIISGTSLTTINIGQANPTGTTTAGNIQLNGNTGNLNATFSFSTVGLVNVQSNSGLFSFVLQGTSAGASTFTANPVLASINLGVNSIAGLTVSNNTQLADLVFSTTTGSLVSGAGVTITDSVLTNLVAPFTQINGDLNINNNAGSFSFAAGATTALTGAITVQGNSGLTSFTIAPTGTNEGAVSVINNANLALLLIGSTTAASQYNPSSVQVGASTVGLTAFISVVSTGPITISTPGTGSSFTNLVIGITNSAGIITNNGDVTIGSLTIASTGTATVNAVQLTSANNVNSINLVNIATITNQLVLTNIGTTGANPTFNASGLSTIGQGFTINNVNGFSTFLVSGLTAIGSGSNANPSPLSFTGSQFASGATVTLSGNFTVNNLVTLSGLTGGANFNFNALRSTASLITIANNVVGTMTFTGLQCASNITISSNSGTSLNFPSLAHLGNGGIATDQANALPITVQGNRGNGNNACYYCAATDGQGLSCGTGATASFSVACSRVNGACPFATVVGSTTSNAATPTTSTGTTSSVTTSTVTPRSSTSATTTTGANNTPTTSTSNNNGAGTTQAATTSPTSSAPFVGATVMVAVAAILAM